MTTVAEPKVYHTKGKDDWGTTQGLYEALDEEFHFDLDVCANDLNHKCPVYLTEEMDALAIEWWGRCFMNPPHSQTEAFLTYMIKMLVEEKIELGVAVVASRTDTAVHHMASCFAGETRYLKGRLSYEVFPTDKQRLWCETLSAVTIDAEAWPGLVKELGLPQTAILALMKDPTIPAGDPRLSQSAPFPSLVYIFDRRPQNATVYWDWKKQQRTVYMYQGFTQGFKKVPSAPWLSTILLGGHKPGKLTQAKLAFAALAEKKAEAKAQIFKSDDLKAAIAAAFPPYTPIGKPLTDALPGEPTHVILGVDYGAPDPGPLTIDSLAHMHDLLDDLKETD